MSKFGSKEQFIENTKEHELTVLHDDGLYRHLMMRKPNSSNMYYEVITWPGYLSIVGDMGSSTFSRIPDMFDFFRTEQLGINLGYWTEKEVSTSKFGKNTEFDTEELSRLLNEWLQRWIESEEPSNEKIENIKQAIEEAPYCENEHAVADFMNEIYDGHELYPIFDQDWWEHSFTKSTGYQEWRLYAINHTIREYDLSTTQTNESK